MHQSLPGLCARGQLRPAAPRPQLQGDTLTSFYKIFPRELVTLVTKRILIEIAAGRAGLFHGGSVTEEPVSS